MAILRTKDIRKMNDGDRETKFNELKLELTKANVTANKTKAKTKELKRAISRLMTIGKTGKEALKTK